jgi:chitodextrinase
MRTHVIPARGRTIGRVCAAAAVLACATTPPVAGAHMPPAAPTAAGTVRATPAPAGGSTFEGKLVLRHADYFSTGKADFESLLELDDGTQLNVDLPTGKPSTLPPGTRVRVTGRRDRNRIAVAADGTQALAAATTTVAAAPATKRVAVVLMNFAGNATQPYTPAYAAGVAFTNTNSVAAYYADNSWGATSMTGDVFGWYTIPNDSATCDYTAWATAANAAAAAAGVDLAPYDNVVYAFPSTSSCGWSGLAYLPGRQSWLNGTGGMSLRTMSHELGHNFGTHHASTMSCTESGARVMLSASCTSNEYGDPFTVMGAASGRWHTNVALGNFGWLAAGNTRDVTTGGDYLLQPIERYDPTGIKALRIARTSSSNLTLEFRQPGISAFDAFPATDPAVNGVSVRVAAPYATGIQSQLVDTTPATTSFSDAPLAVGRTLIDPLTGASITTLSVSPEGAMVRVSLTADTTPPSQPTGLTATALDASRVSLAWAASTDNVGVTGYRVYRDATLLATVTAQTYTDTGLSPGTTYAYRIVAIDAAGNASTAATAGATTTAADTQAPTAPTALTATISKARKVGLSWRASTDNVGVASYRVYRNGALLKTVTTTSATDSIASKGVKATYYVVAVDAAGNVSPPSASVTVTG